MMGSLAERLASAEAAYDRLMTGAAVVEVQDQNGERVRYNAASARQLATYCAELRRQIGGRPAVKTIRFHTSKGF
ncbi:gpW family head-tail joining protein [uncultured Brevundimonas sp.]|uniref:gpW family head-tail joining protein n=1 Tax=uncultured Brevundimonas sp. TaxID=213418 RepID=UPI0025FF935D|nr:gpW family head-tail joining protein [uncultured Brevundimonas sp.]